jgi:PAS domain S-box-containing protein
VVKHSPPSKPGRGLHIAQRDESGAPVRMAGTVTDITERKSAEDRLRTSEAELRVPFESMTDLIFVFDFEGRYLKVAPTNPSLLYRPAPELLGKKLHEVLPRERADEFLAYIRRALETQRSVNLHGGHLWHARRVRGRCAESLPGREDHRPWKPSVRVNPYCGAMFVGSFSPSRSTPQSIASLAKFRGTRSTSCRSSTKDALLALLTSVTS